VLAWLYHPDSYSWLRSVWLPVSAGLALLSLLACIEAIHRQRIPGLLTTSLMLGMFDASLCEVSFVRDGLTNFVQIQVLIQIACACSLITAWIAPRRKAETRGPHLTILTLSWIPTLICDVLWMVPPKWNDSLWRNCGDANMLAIGCCYIAWAWVVFIHPRFDLAYRNFQPIQP
jgi:hypothetical protein